MKEGQKQRIDSSRRKEKEREENTKGNWVGRELGKRKKKTRKSRSLKLLSRKWRNSEKNLLIYGQLYSSTRAESVHHERVNNSTDPIFAKRYNWKSLWTSKWHRTLNLINVSQNLTRIIMKHLSLMRLYVFFLFSTLKNFLDNYSQFCNMRKWVCLQGTGNDNLSK